MKILVCVKNVPDGQSERRIEEGRIIRGEDDVLNDLDEYAVEAAVQLAEETGGEVVAVTMGPESADEALTRALQMGANRAVHVCDDRFAGADAIATARVLGEVIALEDDKAPVDLVLMGMASLDAMTSLVPSAVSELWGQPLVSSVDSIELVGDNTLKTSRDFDGYLTEHEVVLPAVLSVTEHVNEPRYPSFKDIKAARSKPIETLGWDEITARSPETFSTGPELLSVVKAERYTRNIDQRIVQDTGNGGNELAEYLHENLKVEGQ